MSFKNVATFSAALFAVLFLTMMVAPHLATESWGLEATDEVQFMGRRTAAAYLGFAVLSWLVRSVTNSETIRIVALGLSTSLIFVAIVGLWEMIWGIGATGLILSVVVELGLAAAFLKSSRTS